MLVGGDVMRVVYFVRGVDRLSRAAASLHREEREPTLLSLVVTSLFL